MEDLRKTFGYFPLDPSQQPEIPFHPPYDDLSHLPQFRRIREVYEARLDADGNPPPIFRTDFSGGRRFRRTGTAVEDGGLRTPDSARSTSPPPLQHLPAARAPTPPRNALPSPPHFEPYIDPPRRGPLPDFSIPTDAEDIDWPPKQGESSSQTMRLTTSPEEHDWVSERRPVTRSVSAGMDIAFSLSYKSGKTALVHLDGLVADATYEELTFHTTRQQQWATSHAASLAMRADSSRSTRRTRAEKPTGLRARSGIMKRNRDKTAQGGAGRGRGRPKKKD